MSKILSTSLNKFQELTSPEDLHIYRKFKELVLRVQRTRTFVSAPIDVRVRWTRRTFFLGFSTNVRVRWTRNNL
jgi:hypothetical protein